MDKKIAQQEFGGKKRERRDNEKLGIKAGKNLSKALPAP